MKDALQASPEFARCSNLPHRSRSGPESNIVLFVWCNPKPITLPTITKLLTEVAEAVIRRHNVHLPLGQLGVSLILRFEDIVAHSLSYEPGTFGAQYLGLDSIRPTKCCPYFKRCVFFKSQICGMEVPFRPVFDQIPLLPFVMDLHTV